MTFETELDSVLPRDLPNRSSVIEKCAIHLERIAEVNEGLNLTRILAPRDTAIKHVLDSVLPWRHFQSAEHIVDAGTGAGFPGIPLAIVLPQSRFSLVESTGKKSRFVAATVEALRIPNATVENCRAEDFLKGKGKTVITGRAFASLQKACELFSPAIRSGSIARLYKGPDAESEIADASKEASKRKLQLRLLDRFSLPDNAGVRTIVEITSGAPARS